MKDESKRFGLNAFKVLGASYAFARHLSAGQTGAVLRFSDVQSRVNQVRAGHYWGDYCCLGGLNGLLQDTLLVTATDGNHGYGVAYIAKLFNCRAKVGADHLKTDQ